MKKLIDRQEIRIDNHQRAVVNPNFNFDDDNNDIHLDKTTQTRIDGKICEVQIRIPLNSNRPVKITNKGKGLKNRDINNIPPKLQKEIHDAFKDVDRRSRFIEDILGALREYEHIEDNDNKKTKKYEKVLKRVAKAFDVEWILEKPIKGLNLVGVLSAFVVNKQKKYKFSIGSQFIHIEDSSSSEN